jgi:iron complex transport system ATP-binding protein
MSLLSVEHLDVRLDGHEILTDVGFEIEQGTWIGLLGPNGSGKTTLLRAIGAHIPFDGTIQLDGRRVEAWTARERARRLAYVRQAASLTFDFTVEELVLLGRAPHRGWLQAYRSDDRSLVREALSMVDLEGFAERSVLSLSGGEMQRVFLAQALVQEADLLLLDEPTSHLDVHYQFAFMDQVQALVDGGRTVLAVFHDLELAARYAERLLVLQGGQLVSRGRPASVLTPDCIAEVFGMQAKTERRDDGTLRIEYIEPVTGDKQENPAGAEAAVSSSRPT